MEKDKNKKKTLTISGSLQKKHYQKLEKNKTKIFNVYKKKPQGNFFKKPSQSFVNQ